MADYKHYLASRIISEEQIVTYRLLSRSLKIHVNAAKEMLFEFHQQQNKKKPGTVHATYLIAGTKRKDGPPPTNGKADGEYECMQSSPFMSSSMPQPEENTGESVVLSITLTREEDLDVISSQYEQISSIHIYSLGPSPLKDLQVITDTEREIQTLTSTEDPLNLAVTYGSITNPLVRRRTTKRPPPPPAPVAAAPVPTKAPKSKLNEVQTAAQSSTSAKEGKSQPSSAKDFFAKNNKGGAGAKLKRETSNASTGSKESKEGTPIPPLLAPVTLKRDPSSIFEAFAKTKPKKAKQGKAKEKEDEVMQDAGLSDDGEEDESAYEETKTSEKLGTEEAEGTRAKKREREERLKAMMDIEDEEEAAKPTREPEAVPEEDEPEEEKKEEETTAGGRRRGRRRVMKKKTFKDEDGYLVTKEEPAWESYSEDEPAPAPKPKPKTQPAPAPAAKSKKAAGKQGQGNIMSFFGKK